ncbi:MAG: HNH endonuclease [Rubellimicrobium sp.]|nr:HNH endonuclease [Rubellimicrobium sp.]
MAPAKPHARIPASLLVLLLVALLVLVAGQAPLRPDGEAAALWPGEAAPACDRASFGGWWQSAYRNTRFDILADAALGGLHVREGGGGTTWRVLSGSWIDPYSGRLLENVPAQAMEIDHVIPVCWAWAHGADAWDRDTKRRFYNDRRYLLAVEAGLNRLKGARGPDLFMPMNRAFACDYARLFLDGVAAYRLQVPPDEMARIEDARDLACAGRAPAA